MAPELVEAFIVEFNAELRRAAHEAEGERASARRALGEVERKIAGILRAIEDGAYNPTLTSRLTTLEAEKAAAETRLAGAERRRRPSGCIPTCRRSTAVKSSDWPRR